MKKRKSKTLVEMSKKSSDNQRIVAVLGPTNTGKTHLAMKRMLNHKSGIIGFPLRLLARENYDRALAIKGQGQVALITGEEKIVPPFAKYFFCTIESMPLERNVAFIGIDEIQMCADPDRGHIFTDRLLFARGKLETMFMGANTIRPLLRHLIPKIQFETRPRLSSLKYIGKCKVARLKPRSAVVAFNVEEVYSFAEQIRRQRGGSAVVLGALSPRTRNAQIDMYQNGEVDYLVATDAIGMGLNMDVDHVAFASTRKFDGRNRRNLLPAELAQTAGRAGRYKNDGTFGITGNIRALEKDTIEQIESHSFEALKFLFWRNSTLDFSTLKRLQQSLAQPPVISGLLRAREADDELVFKRLAEMKEIIQLANNPYSIELLWKVCHIPDFSQILSDAHAGLLSVIYHYLMGKNKNGTGHLPSDWLASQVSRLDNTQGDIETLSGRIASIRTWTYIAFQSNWLEDYKHWQNTTRVIEDRLSDALHQRLTQRFVDKRTAVLVNHVKNAEKIPAFVNSNGTVTVEGYKFGVISGFRFQPDNTNLIDDNIALKKITNAAIRALKGEITARLKKLLSDDDSQFKLGKKNKSPIIVWRGHLVANLEAGSTLLKPVVKPLTDDLLEISERKILCHRCQSWLNNILKEIFAPLLAALSSPNLSSPSRGLIFQLGENLGCLQRHQVTSLINSMSKSDRKSLKPFGIRIGRHWVFLPTLLKSRAIAMRGLLWGVWNNNIVTAPKPGLVSIPIDSDVPQDFYRSIGYDCFQKLAIRCDIVERLASIAWKLSSKGAFKLDENASQLASLAGCGVRDIEKILQMLGYVRKLGENNFQYFERNHNSRTNSNYAKSGLKQKKYEHKIKKQSPFASLEGLLEDL